MSNPIKNCVFVAKVSDSLQDYRQNLVRELTLNGFKVFEPSESDIENEGVIDIIAKCHISIHLLSNHDFGHYASNVGIEEQQINHAIQFFLKDRPTLGECEKGAKIYAWHLKTGIENAFVEQQLASHIKKVQLLEEIEFVRSNFEDFKHYLLRQLDREKPNDPNLPAPWGSRNLTLYFLHDYSDKESAVLYVDYFTQLGFDVVTSSMQSDILKTREIHSSYLKTFDIAIIFAINANSNWINMKVMDVLKSPGLGREKQILGKAIFTIDANLDSIALRQRGFEFISTDSGTYKSQSDQLIKKLNF